MRDPDPENIAGRKSVSWEFTVNLGYVALGLAAIYIVYQVSRLFPDRSDEESAAGADAASIEVEGTGETAKFDGFQAGGEPTQ